MEDIITDSVAEPVRLPEDWLPKKIRAADSSAAGQLFAHAGIKAAADAVLQACAAHVTPGWGSIPPNMPISSIQPETTPILRHSQCRRTK